MVLVAASPGGEVPSSCLTGTLSVKASLFLVCKSLRLSQAARNADSHLESLQWVWSALPHDSRQGPRWAGRIGCTYRVSDTWPRPCVTRSRSRRTGVWRQHQPQDRRGGSRRKSLGKGEEGPAEQGGCQKQKGPRKQPRDMQPCMLSPWLICGVMLEGRGCMQPAKAPGDIRAMVLVLVGAGARSLTHSPREGCCRRRGRRKRSGSAATRSRSG
jgi:hypothetical protein